MEAIEKPHLTPDQFRAWAAHLAVDDGFKELLRVLKADVLQKWANEPDAVKRESLYHDIQAVGRLEAKVQVLAEDRQIDQRKEAKRKGG